MEEEYKKDRNSEALKSGLTLGLLSIIILALSYIIDVTLLGSWKLGVVSSVLSLAFVIYMGRKFRNEESDGYMGFKPAFLYSFVAFFVSSIVSAAFLILLYEVIDTEAPKILADQAIENTEKMMRSFGAPEEKIEEALDQLELEMEKNFSAQGIAKNSWVYFFTSALLSLITGLVIRKSKPDFE
ncbi:MAG: DUF4199 domain-containing protein [Cyclobacteriaceae bacterium]